MKRQNPQKTITAISESLFVDNYAERVHTRRQDYRPQDGCLGSRVCLGTDNNTFGITEDDKSAR